MPGVAVDAVALGITGYHPAMLAYLTVVLRLSVVDAVLATRFGAPMRVVATEFLRLYTPPVAPAR